VVLTTSVLSLFRRFLMSDPDDEDRDITDSDTATSSDDEK